MCPVSSWEPHLLNHSCRTRAEEAILQTGYMHPTTYANAGPAAHTCLHMNTAPHPACLDIDSHPVNPYDGVRLALRLGAIHGSLILFANKSLARAIVNAGVSQKPPVGKCRLLIRGTSSPTYSYMNIHLWSTAKCKSTR